MRNIMQHIYLYISALLEIRKPNFPQYAEIQEINSPKGLFQLFLLLKGNYRKLCIKHFAKETEEIGAREKAPEFRAPAALPEEQLPYPAPT